MSPPILYYCCCLDSNIKRLLSNYSPLKQQTTASQTLWNQDGRSLTRTSYQHLQQGTAIGRTVIDTRLLRLCSQSTFCPVHLMKKWKECILRSTTWIRSGWKAPFLGYGLLLTCHLDIRFLHSSTILPSRRICPLPRLINPRQPLKARCHSARRDLRLYLSRRTARPHHFPRKNISATSHIDLNLEQLSSMLA
jgi:hypothetical protein